MIVEPPQQYFFRLEFVDDFGLLILTFEEDEFWVISDVDGPVDVDFDDLPDQPQNQMLLLLPDELRVYVDDHTAD